MHQSGYAGLGGRGRGKMKSWGYITQIPEESRRQFIVECLEEYIGEADELDLMEQEPEIADIAAFYAEIIRLLKKQ